MPEYQISIKSKRNFWIFSVLVFLAGVCIGLVFGIFGLRYLFFRYPPHPDDMVKKVAERVQHDYGLDDDARKSIEEESRLFFNDVKQMIAETREEIDKKLRERVNRMAEAFPDDASRQRWLQEYQRYFPKRPPPPPGPPPHPPPPRVH